MPDPDLTLPPVGASAEDILRTLLPVVIQAATEAAKGSTAASVAVQSLDKQVAELRASVQENCDALKKFTLAQEVENERLARERDDEKAKAEESKESQNKKIELIGRFIKPDFVVYLITLVLALLGLRATLPGPSLLDTLNPSTVVEEAP